MAFDSTTVGSNFSEVMTFIEGKTDSLNRTHFVTSNTSTSWSDLFSTENQFSTVAPAQERETSDLFMTEEDVRIFTFVTRSFISPIVCLFGFVGNSFGIGVLWRQARQQKLSIFWYLCALTITDNVWLGLGLVDSVSRIAQAFDMNLAKYLMTHFKLGTAYCDSTSLHSARYIVVVMSCERLLSVFRPLHVKETWFAKYPVRLIMACVLFNAVFNLPIVINATVITKQMGNTTEYIFTFKHYKEFMAHFWFVETIIHSFIPMLMLIAINIAIPLQLSRASTKFRNAMNKDSSNPQAKVTTILTTITVMYIFLSVPMLGAKFLQYINPDFNMNGKYRLYFWCITDLGRCLAYVNAANDFPVYFLVSSNYRAIFKQIYCSWGKRSKIQRGSYRNATTSRGSGGISKNTMSMSASG